MKKLSIYFLIIVCLFMTGCGNDKEKVAITLDDFDKTLTDKEFTVYDNMDDYSGIDYIVMAKKAVLDDIEIEMIKYTTNDYAVKVQDSQIENFNLLKNTGAYEDKEKGRGELEIVICDSEEKERALKEFERVFNKKVINI